MPTPPKNNKSQGSRRYTTRQIMDLTEKRRRQMDEEAKLRKLLAPLSEASEPDGEASVQLPQEEPVEASVEAPVKETAIEETANAEVLDETAVASPQAPEESVDGKTVAGLFRQTPETPAEKSVSGLIENEFNKAIDETLSLSDTSLREAPEMSKPAKTRNDTFAVPLEESAPLLEKPVKARPAAARKKFFSRQLLAQILDLLVFGLSLGLMTMMMSHLLWVGWARHYYDQSPFVLMMVLSMVWLNRVNFRRREEWFWGSTVIVAGGLGVFIAAAMEGFSYIELTGFLIVCFGLFLWRYQEESTCRLFFPLAAMFFIFAPPAAWEQALIMPLNDCVYHLSSWAVNSFHVPVHYDGQQFHVSGGTIFFMGDPTVFRSVGIGLLWALTCLSFQSLAPAWSIVLFVSVVVWAIVANIVRIATTGLILENFGFDYAANFFVDYSIYVVLLLMLAGIFLTAGFLPHQEDFE